MSAIEACVSSIVGALNGNEESAVVLCEQFASSTDLEATTMGLNTLYLVLCGALVFVMHAGFAMVRERVLFGSLPRHTSCAVIALIAVCAHARSYALARFVQRTRVSLLCWKTAPFLFPWLYDSILLFFSVNILLQTVMDAAVSALAFYSLG